LTKHVLPRLVTPRADDGRCFGRVDADGRAIPGAVYIYIYVYIILKYYYNAGSQGCKTAAELNNIIFGYLQGTYRQI